MNQPKDPPATPTPEAKKSVAVALPAQARDIVTDTLLLVLALGSIYFIGRVTHRLLGEDFKFFSILPIEYVIDLMHLAVLARFVWKTILQIRKV